MLCVVYVGIIIISTLFIHFGRDYAHLSSCNHVQYGFETMSTNYSYWMYCLSPLTDHLATGKLLNFVYFYCDLFALYFQSAIQLLVAYTVEYFSVHNCVQTG